MPPEDNELFNDEFMNDMLLNPKAYDIPDGLEDEEDEEEWKTKNCEIKRFKSLYRIKTD